MRMILLFGVFFSFSVMAEVKKYELTVERKSMNLSGKKSVDFALTVNGGIPAPTLTFQEGDIAEILVHNKLSEEVSIHWHGLLLPPEQDGVSYVNTPPIHAGKSHTFRFPIRQSGTYWYHSHTGLQEQKGVYGAFIIQPKKAARKTDHDWVVVLSDWSDENPDQVLKNLKKDGDYYLYKKKSIRSYFGAIGAGGLGELLKNEWQRMGGMDLSDVGYDAFLVNGKREAELGMAHRGETVRLRIINAGASSYFLVSLSGLPFEVVSADGVEVEPFLARELLMGMAETFDIVFTLPEQKTYELRATAQDITGYSSAWFGMGDKVPAPAKSPLNLYAPMDHSGHGGASASHGGAHDSGGHVHSSNKMDHSHGGGHGDSQETKVPSLPMDHSAHESHIHPQPESSVDSHGTHTSGKGRISVKENNKREGKNLRFVEGSVTVDSLKAASATKFPDSTKVLEVKLALGGDMERYVWHINGKAIHEDRTLTINEGQVIRYTFKNETMMHHPMHLHGHFFRVLNSQGDFSPLKHTVDVPPHGERTIEFLANEPGDWMLHCHNLFHMKTGMARVVSYSTFTPKQEIAQHQKHDPHLHDHIYWDGFVEAATQEGKGFFRLSRTWDTVEILVESKDENRHWDWSGDLFYRRWMGNYWNLILGGTSFESHQRATGGLGLILPMLIEADFLVDHRGDLRLTAEKKFQWTSHFLSNLEISWREKRGLEWTANLLYQPSWHWGVGIFRNDEKWGVGGKFRF